MFTRSMYQTEDQGRQQEILQKVGDLYNSGHLQTTVTQVLGPINAENIKAAHKMLSKGKMIGKVVLTGWDK